MEVVTGVEALALAPFTTLREISSSFIEDHVFPLTLVSDARPVLLWEFIQRRTGIVGDGQDTVD